MTVTLELSPEVEAGLAAMAAARGLALPQYLQQLLGEQLPKPSAANLSPAERAAAWCDIHGLPIVPPLSDEAISRETIYNTRG